MSIEKVSNVFESFKQNNNKPVSKPVVYTSVKKASESDSFYSRHKTAVITGGVIAGIIALDAAAKKGILGENIRGFINKLFSSNSVPETATVQTIAHKSGENLEPEKILENIRDTASNFQKNTRKFFNISGETVDISLKKGHASYADGSAFSGYMTTMNNKGEEAILLYEDGWLSGSIVDKKMRKIFINTAIAPLDGSSEPVIFSRNQACNIMSAGPDGVLSWTATHYYNENGKISKIIRPFEDEKFTIIEFGEKGCVSSQYTTNKFVSSLKGKVFDENSGLLKKEVEISDEIINGGRIDERIYSDDGKIIVKELRSWTENPRELNLAGSENIAASKFKAENPFLVTYYNADGSIDKRVGIYSGWLEIDDHPNGALVSADLDGSIIAYVQNRNRKRISINNGIIENLDDPMKKSDIECIIQQLKDAVKIAEKENLHNDGFIPLSEEKAPQKKFDPAKILDWIKQLKEYAEKMT